jgi:hypothetical protein
MSIKGSAQAALEVQGACNLLAVVRAFSRAADDVVKDLEKNEGFNTDAFNHHPICRLFSEQIAHLARARSYSDAYKRCEELAGVKRGE